MSTELEVNIDFIKDVYIKLDLDLSEKTHIDLDSLSEETADNILFLFLSLSESARFELKSNDCRLYTDDFHTAVTSILFNSCQHILNLYSNS